jgi:phage shock protein A
MSRNPTITERLADLQSWRYGLSALITQVRELLGTHEFLTPNADAAFREILERVMKQRVTIAFIAEVSRGKSELINGLFFADLGRRLLPSGPGKGTRCVTELRFDRDVKTCVRLLPVETRESPKSLDELVRDESQWRSILFDSDNAESTARALAALSETKRISLSDAVAWGLHREGVAVPAGESDSTLVDVPRWRYAIVNYPHPMLDAGLVIIDTPGLAAFTSEPELARHRAPGADALLMVLDITQGAAKADLAIWRDHLGNARSFRDREREESTQTRIVVLNKIDELTVDTADPTESGKALLREIDKRSRDTADLLRIDPIKVIAVSARLGLAGKLGNDNDKSIRSRLYQLERALATGLPSDRNEVITADALAVLSTSIESAQSILDGQRYETLEGLRNLSRLREKNAKLAEAVSSKMSSRHDRLDSAMRELKSIKSVHNKLNEELAAIVDLNAAKKDAARARAAILTSVLPGKTVEIVHQYFSLTREKLDGIDSKIEEIRNLYSSIGERMRQDFELDLHEVHPFATQRFYTELEKAQSKAETEFTKTSNLLVRRGSALAEQFDELLSSRVIHIFEIASREAVSWMRGLYLAVEKPLEALREHMVERHASIEKLKAAELELAGQIAELQARIDGIKRKHASLAEARERLERYSRNDEDEDVIA